MTALRGLSDFFGFHVGLFTEPEPDAAYRLELGRPPGGIVGIHHGDTVVGQMAKEPEFCGQIRRHVGVVVEVLAAQVREHGGGELYGVHTTLVECVRGDFHREPLGARRAGLGQVVVELERPWRRHPSARRP